MAQSRDGSQARRWPISARRDLLAIVVAVTALLTSAVVEIVLDNTTIGTSAPPDLPEHARAGFEKIKSDVVYRSSPFMFQSRGVGGITVLHSPLLARSFPDYCFVRVLFGPGYYWWTPGMLKASSLPGSNSVVCAFPLTGEDPVEFHHRHRYEEAGKFFSRNGVQVRTQADAEHVRRLMLELYPLDLAIAEFREHEQVSDTEWRIAMQRLGGSSFLEVKTDPDGYVRHVKHRVLTNQKDQPQQGM